MASGTHPFSSMTEESTPKTPRSIVRNHSPYSESTGPIVQEGFVAARIRALQGFSDQVPNINRSHTPFTPCPPRWPHVRTSHSPPKPSLAPKPVLSGTDIPYTGTVKRLHTQILLKGHQKFISATGSSARSLNSVHSSEPHEQQSSFEPTTLTRPYGRGKITGNPSANLIKDVVSSPRVQRNQDLVTAPSTQYYQLSEAGQVDDIPAENSLPSEMFILSPHAIQADLIEPRTAWNCLPQMEDCGDDYIHEPALEPRGSIADKLGSMVERGWVGSEISGQVYNDQIASHSAESESQIRSRRPGRPDSRTYSSDEMSRLKKTQSGSQHLTGQDALLHPEQEDPGLVANPDSQKRTKRRGKRSPAANTPQRSSSDTGVHYLKTEPATPTRDRRAWTVHYLGRSLGSHSQTWTQPYPTTWRMYAWDRRSSELGHGSTTLPRSREGSITRSDSDQTMLGNEQLGHVSTALSIGTGSRRSSANTKQHSRSASRSTSFFKKFPWYKVALVDKQPVARNLSKESNGKNKIIRAPKVALQDPKFSQIERSRAVSKSYPLVEYGHKGDENSAETGNPQHQGQIDRQANGALSFYHRASSQSSFQLMTSPQEMDGEQRVFEDTRSATKSPHGSYPTRLNIREERLSRRLDQAVENVVGHAETPLGARPSSTQPRVSSRSGSMVTNFESPILDKFLQPLRYQVPEVEDHSRMKLCTLPDTESMGSPADSGLKKESSGSGTARTGQGFMASSSLSPQPRSEMACLTPRRLGSGTDSLLGSVHRSDQHEPASREVKGGGKGIRKIQVTVTFDGAEDLVIEATLGKRNGHEYPRTTG